MLGLAQRAGKLISGEELVIKAVQSGQARLVFLANDAGSNVTKKTTDKCNYYNIEVSTVFNALELSMAIGKPRKTVAVVDAGFSKKPIAEISEQVGYSNQWKFAAVFKKQFGLSPLEYRRSKNLENR